MYLGVVFLVNKKICSNQHPDLNGNSFIILGDSHPMRGLNPEKFENAVNISQFAEPYIVTYWKLQNILDHNFIDTILLGFAPHNIAAFNDYKFLDETWAYEMFKRSYSLKGFNDFNIGEINNRVYYKVLLNEMCLYPRMNHIHYLGKYSNSKKSNVLNWKGPITRHFFYDGIDIEESSISHTAIDYLDSIRTLCADNNISLILVNAPVHKSYLKNIPPYNMDEYQKLKTSLDLQKTIILDHSENNYPDSFFFNPDHLNAYGAEQFTLEVLDVLESR